MMRSSRCLQAAQTMLTISLNIMRSMAMKVHHTEIKVNTDVVRIRKMPVFSRRMQFCRGTGIKTLRLPFALIVPNVAQAFFQYDDTMTLKKTTGIASAHDDSNFHSAQNWSNPAATMVTPDAMPGNSEGAA